MKRSGYETLRNISDQRNQDDPKYDPGLRPGGFETYQQQRQETLHPAAVPNLPPPDPPIAAEP